MSATLKSYRQHYAYVEGGGWIKGMCSVNQQQTSIIALENQSEPQKHITYRMQSTEGHTSSCLHSGMSSSNARGSNTFPDSTWAPAEQTKTKAQITKRAINAVASVVVVLQVYNTAAKTGFCVQGRAPTSAPFSRTQTERSASAARQSCFSRMAATSSYAGIGHWKQQRRAKKTIANQWDQNPKEEPNGGATTRI